MKENKKSSYASAIQKRSISLPQKNFCRMLYLRMPNDSFSALVRLRIVLRCTPNSLAVSDTEYLASSTTSGLVLVISGLLSSTRPS